MAVKPVVLDSRTSEDIYRQTLELARSYCTDWTAKWPADPDYFNPDDPGMVILKLFSGLTGSLITQLNKVPDKHFLAFLDFVGIDLLSARPSKVPLTFCLSEGASPVYVPFRTAVASAKNPDVVFETMQGLSVIDSKLAAVYSLNPWNDVYTEHADIISPGKKDSYIFGAKDGNEKNIEHILFLGDDNIFDIRRETQLTINIAGTGLSREHFKRWQDVDNNELNADLSGFPKIKLDINKIGKSYVNGKETFWISVKPDSGTKIVKKEGLPKINSISVVDLSVDNIIPEAALANNAPIDMKKGGYPFGEVPKTGDAFYMGCDEAFSKKDALITVYITIEGKTGGSPVIVWEYWNGKEWTSLEQSFNLKTTGTVSFKCPSVEQVEINGQKNRWIRARIFEGNYGTSEPFTPLNVNEMINSLKTISETVKASVIKEMTENKIAFGFKLQDPTLAPPFIKKLTVGYRYEEKAAPFEVQQLTTCNNFQYKTITSSQFDPYEPLEETPALYLGFDMNVAGKPISLYFATKEKVFGEKLETVTGPNHKDMKPEDEAKEFVWKYFNGKEWRDFEVQDETDSFKTDGIIDFQAPSDVMNTDKFSKNLCWIRVEPKNGKWFYCPRLSGIFTNTVWAVNSVTTEDEILGSSNGVPSLSLSFSKKPILQGQIIEIREPGIPAKDELDIIEKEEGNDSVRVMREESGEVKEIWVRWHEVSDFALSLPLSRHYVIDRANGKIIFGDGIKGMLPPKGKNNIKAKKYKSGGGKAGNMNPKTITMLKKSIPGIGNVTNNVSSSGGVDQESQNGVFIRGPHAIRNRNRAVTREDFEWLAREASQDVVKAKCVPVQDGKISVIIVPSGDDETPLPEAGLLDAVKQYLTGRTLLTIQHKVEVVGPAYKQINVDVTVKPISFNEDIIVKERVQERLKLFLHPLKGGQNSEGWDFGQSIFISEIAAVIEDIEGVDYIKKIELKLMEAGVEKDVAPGAENKTWIGIEENSLPCAGPVSVKTEMGE